MRLLTLNTHSLVEEDYPRKLTDFVNGIYTESPDIIALQEVNQTASDRAVSEKDLEGYVPCGDNILIREDNHVFNAVRLLRQKGLHYYWTWLPMKLGYDKYDEGIALMSLSPIIETDTLLVSGINDYRNWKTRKIIGIRTENAPDEWFYSVHYGWYGDIEEPFQRQWERTSAYMKNRGTVWLMGDFNSPSEVRNEGYDKIISDGFFDSYTLSEKKDRGITVTGVIDGWKEKLTSADGMRIDHIWCSKRVGISSSEVIFSGKNYPVVSDHYGVMIERKLL